jgi:pyrroline-5-carboxylate reductase
MGEALAAGLSGRGWGADRLVVVEPVAARRQHLAESAGLVAVATLDDAVRHLGPGPVAPGAVIAVKPHDVAAAASGLAGQGIELVLSIAAGVAIADLEEWAGPTSRVLRAMPNTPALVAAAASALAAGRRATADDVAWAESVLSAVGTVVTLDEAALDAVTGLSGSGPAYVFLLAEALIDAGVLAGLSRPVARDLAVQTLLGSARLLAETGEEPSALRAAVTSPGGTTAAGLRVLEAAGVRSAVLEAVHAATERSRQLGDRH